MKEKELLLEISYNCNLKCIHCSSINCEGKLKLEDIPKLVNLDEISTVRISGGCPLLNKDLSDYCNLFKDNGTKVILQTNGTGKLSEYKSLNVDEIWISFYGSPEIHNFITMNNTYYHVRNIILFLYEYYSITIQSAIFNEVQLQSLSHELNQLNMDFSLSDNNVDLRLFALLNQGRCNFALSIPEQVKIYNNIFYKYPNTELTCSLDPSYCNYNNKLVLKPDKTLFNCASHKHGKSLCKK